MLCRKCGENKTSADFYLKPKSVCKDCVREMARKYGKENRDKSVERTRIWREKNRERYSEWERKRGVERRERIRQIKDSLKDSLGGKCVKCGFSDKRALMFHHKDGRNKQMNIGDTANKNFDELLVEAKKCELLCANCHFVHHHIRSL